MGVRHTMLPLASALASTTTWSRARSRGWDLQHATNDICIAPCLAESGTHNMGGLMKVAKSLCCVGCSPEFTQFTFNNGHNSRSKISVSVGNNKQSM